MRLSRWTHGRDGFPLPEHSAGLLAGSSDRFSFDMQPAFYRLKPARYDANCRNSIQPVCKTARRVDCGRSARTKFRSG
jgi:hypothetical protein